jgi:type II restriction/modification system DNA methylase subunit YeeA
MHKFQATAQEKAGELQRIEILINEQINRAAKLTSISPNIPIEQITLTVNPAYRYGGKLTEAEQWTRFRGDTMKELVSYAIGCMMGRYSLDEPGLIYADSGNQGFDPGRYPSFPADDDGIVPLSDSEWLDDDAARRLEEFLSLAWPDDNVANDDSQVERSNSALSTQHSPLNEQNLAFLAANLAPKKTESSRDTIRRYLCDRFYKDHLQTYKKRPIYWLFSSGKLRAFQCLVYLHRYNEGTLARMRMEYAVPLQGKLSARIDGLSDDIDAAETGGTTAQANRLRKQRDKRVKQLEELRRYDVLLRHYADQRIPLDLDDGVKRNYGKFGPLLAEVRAVTGKAPR